jgi:hypothetical protein
VVLVIEVSVVPFNPNTPDSVDFSRVHNLLNKLATPPHSINKKIVYGGVLPRAKGRKSKRKMTAEEYLEVETPAKKAKAASDKLKIGGSTLPPTEEAATPLVVPDQPAIPKRKRKPVTPYFY